MDYGKGIVTLIMMLVVGVTGCLYDKHDSRIDELENRIYELKEENKQLEATCRDMTKACDSLSGTLTRLKEAFDLVDIDLIEFGEFTQEELKEYRDMGYEWWEY